MQSPATPEHIPRELRGSHRSEITSGPERGGKELLCRNMNFLGFLFRHAVSNTISKPNECVFHKS